MKTYFRVFITLTSLAVATFTTSSSATASISLGSIPGGVVSELEDDDFELLVNAGGTVLAPGYGFDSTTGLPIPGGDFTLDVDDFIAGILRITSVRVPPGGPQAATASDTEATLTAIFLTKIASVSVPLGGGLADGNNDVFITFAAPTAAEWAAVFAGTSAPLPSAAGTMAIVFEDSNNIDQTLPIGSAFATPDGTMAWEFGFLGNPGERWTSNVDTASLLDQFLIGTGSFSANLNVTAYGSGPALVPQPVAPPLGAFADILLRNGSVGNRAPGSSFPVSSDVDILVHRVIPEPSSMLAWSGLVGAGLLIRLRRARVLH